MKPFCLLLSLAWVSAALGQEMPQPIIEGQLESLWLDAWANPKAWWAAESTLTASEKLPPDSRPALRFHIDVDHHAGEPKYPIGWPRMDLRLQELWAQDWRPWDHFEFWIYTEFSRNQLPKTPLTLLLYCPDKSRAWLRELPELKIGEWARFALPVSEMKNVEDVRTVKFSISESHYQDKDTLDFFIGSFRFVRSTECKLGVMEILSPAVFPDRPLKVRLEVEGPPPKVSRGIPFVIRQENAILRQETLPVQRGAQTLEMEIVELKLAPGEYSLVAFPEDGERTKTAKFRVIESPWPQ